VSRLSQLDPYRPGSSLVHRLDPRLKTGLALGFILATALAPYRAWPVYIILAAVIWAVTILAELPTGVVLARLALALPFSLTVLPLLVTTPGVPLVHLPWNLAVTREGLMRSSSIAVKACLSVQAAAVMTTTTRFPALLAALRVLGMPRLLIAIVGLMWRYLFVLVDEAWRLLRARSSRSARLPGQRAGGHVLWRAKVTGGMAGSLFIRAFERADRIYIAMVARGYDGEIRTFRLAPLSFTQKGILAVGLGGLAVLTIVGLLLWG